MLAGDSGAADTGGRRPKASKERNRGKGYEMGCGARYGELSATRDSEAGCFSPRIGLECLRNFGDMARVLLMGKKGFPPRVISKSYAWQKEHIGQLLRDEPHDNR